MSAPSHSPSESHSSSKSNGPSVTKGAVGTMTGMIGFLFTGLVDNSGGGGGHDSHGHH